MMFLPSFDSVGWLTVLLAALCVGLAKGGFGGVNMLAILLMAQAMPPRESTGAILPLLIIGDIFAVSIYRKHATAAIVLRLLPPALVGIVIGWAIMPSIPAEFFGPVIGWVTLSLLVLTIFQKFQPAIATLAAEHPLTAWFFGATAGTTTMLANAAGPVTTIYLLARQLPKMEFVGTAAWFFFAVNLAKIPFSISLGLINPGSLALNLCLAPAVILGVAAGRWLLGKVNQSAFEWLMIVFTLIGALRLILS